MTPVTNVDWKVCLLPITACMLSKIFLKFKKFARQRPECHPFTCIVKYCKSWRSGPLCAPCCAVAPAPPRPVPFSSFIFFHTFQSCCRPAFGLFLFEEQKEENTVYQHNLRTGDTDIKQASWCEENHDLGGTLLRWRVSDALSTLCLRSVARSLTVRSFDLLNQQKDAVVWGSKEFVEQAARIAADQMWIINTKYYVTSFDVLA